MYQKNDTINNQGFKKIQVSKLNGELAEKMLITGATFPEHTSPRYTYIIFLEGDIQLHINSEMFQLKKHQDFKFPYETKLV